jgi:hypothetical protein
MLDFDKCYALSEQRAEKAACYARETPHSPKIKPTTKARPKPQDTAHQN